MVSKITKKTAKAPKTRRSWTPSPIRRSLRFCRRKLSKVFGRCLFFPASTPKNLGFRRLKPLSPEESPLPPPSNPSRKTIFLDLDETLVHSTPDPAPDKYDFIIYPRIDGQITPFYVLKRPGADEFLKKAAEGFEVVIFTAALREYASLVLDLLDPKGEMISHRLYRESCKEIAGRFVKDLSELGRDMGSVAIVDDNPCSYLFQRENAVPIKAFVSDAADRELERVSEFLEIAALFDDMRDAVRCFLFADEYDDDIVSESSSLPHL